MNKFTRRILEEANIPPEEMEAVAETNPYLINNPVRAMKIFDKYTNRYFLADQEEKGALYLDDEILIKMCAMKNMTKNILLYILRELPKNAFEIDLQLNDLKKMMDISINTYYTSLDELASIGLITKKKKSLYWINPHMVFKGNRPLSVIKTYGEQFVHIVVTLTSKPSLFEA